MEGLLAQNGMIMSLDLLNTIHTERVCCMLALIVTTFELPSCHAFAHAFESQSLQAPDASRHQQRACRYHCSSGFVTLWD
jgi:hypothetical protein